MGFFSKLFRKRTDPAHQEAPVVTDGNATPASDPSHPSEAEHTTPPAPPVEALATAPAAETPWWEASTPASADEKAPAAEAQAVPTSPGPVTTDALLESPVMANAAPAEASALDQERDESQLLHQDLIVTQPVTAVTHSRLEQDATRELGEEDAPTPALRPSAQGLTAAALRDIGRVRQINQDSLFSLLTTLPREGGDISMGLFVVADGMGGHDGGEVASRIAVSSVVRHILSHIVVPALEDGSVDALQPVMIEAIKEANRSIWNQAQADGSDMGTTCTAVLMLGSALYVSHVGDSRAYVLEPDGMRLLTNDHSAVGRLIQLGQLAPSEAREHPLRSQLYRTVGQHPEVQVDFVYHHIGESTHLLMGSDGLWSLLEEERMEQALRAYLWPQDACRELVSLANLAGGDDNISVVVVSFHIAERATA